MPQVRVTAGVLWLGNVRIGGTEDTGTVADIEALNIAAELLQVGCNYAQYLLTQYPSGSAPQWCWSAGYQ